MTTAHPAARLEKEDCEVPYAAATDMADNLSRAVSDKSKKIEVLNTRYSAASSEINQRINARQLSYLGHVTAAAAILLIFVEKLTRSAPGPHEPTREEILLVLSPALISLAFACWIRSQDLIIGMLSTFCRVCEELIEDLIKEEPTEKATETATTINPPAWHGGWWSKNSMRNREWIEVAFVLINALAVVVATAYSIGSWNQRTGAATAVPFASWFLLGLSCWMVLSIGTHRAWLTSLKYTGGNVCHGDFCVPDKVSPRPTDVMLGIGLGSGALAVSLGWLCAGGLPHAVVCQSFGLAMLFVAGIIIVTADLRDSKIRRMVDFPDRDWKRFRSAYWLVPALLFFGALVALLTTFFTKEW